MLAKGESVSIYYKVFAALIVMTFVTIGVSYIDLGEWHIVVGLLIAACKAGLVLLFFMHLLESSKLTWIVLGVGMFWLALMLILTLSDYVTRKASIY